MPTFIWASKRFAFQKKIFCHSKTWYKQGIKKFFKKVQKSTSYYVESPKTKMHDYIYIADHSNLRMQTIWVKRVEKVEKVCTSPWNAQMSLNEAWIHFGQKPCILEKELNVTN